MFRRDRRVAGRPSNSAEIVFAWLLLLFLISLPDIAASAITKREVALLDLADHNNDNAYSTFGLSQALEVAGIPYVMTTSLDRAIQYPVIVTTSWLAGNTLGTGDFGQAQKDRLAAYVSGGGVLVATNMYASALFPVFGISSHTVKSTRYTLAWQTATHDSTLAYFDDPNEQTISLGSSTYAKVIRTRGYTLSTALALANFDDGTVAVTRNAWGAGTAYALGFSYTDLILRNQLDRDFNAERTPYDGFEPTSDTIMLFLRRVYETHVPFAAWRFTAPFPARSVLMLTHDVHPKKQSFDLAVEFAKYEKSIGVSATYNVQTNYLTEPNGDRYTPFLPQLQALAAINPRMGAHTVGHFHDWSNETNFPVGSPGNTRASYNPTTDGITTVGGSVYGELEVPKRLIESDAGGIVRTFRSGALYWNEKQANVLDTLGFRYDSSNSANDVLTNFPYLLTYDRAFGGAKSSVYEIPLTIRDRMLSAANYESRVTSWLSVIEKNTANFAPTVILIHPHMEGGLAAEKSLLQQLPPGVGIRTIDGFGDFWRARKQFEFRTTLFGKTLTITVLDGTPLPSQGGFSLYVRNGRDLSGIVVRTQSGEPLRFEQASDGGSGLFLHRIGD
jgi:hypothetical protein